MRHGHRSVFAFSSSMFPAACLTLSLFASAAVAHVTLVQREADAGTDYQAALRVGHGCAGSPVTELIVTLPPGVQGGKPMAKAGWQIEVLRAPAAPKSVAPDVVRIRWHGGRLDATQFDDFVLLVRLPDQPGPLYWPVTQICETGRVDWVEQPGAGQTLHDLKNPAALLTLRPATAAAAASAHVH